MSRKWEKRPILNEIKLYIFDELHLLPEAGSSYEVLCSRVRYKQQDVEGIRIVALAASLANAKDIASWLGIAFPANTFNFSIAVRPVPLDI